MAQKDLIDMASAAPLAVLVELNNVLPRIIAQKRAESEAETRAALEELARERGFNVHDLFGRAQPQERQKRAYTRRGEGTPKEKAEPRFRLMDGDVVVAEWSGRGRKPTAIKEWEDADPENHKLADLEIPME